MKRSFAATALALALIGGAVTTAQADNRDRHERRYDRRDDRHDDRRDYRRDHRRDDRHWDHHEGRHDRHDWDRRDWNRYHGFHRYDGHRYYVSRYVSPSGYYYRSWGYGDCLPRAYYGRRYIVDDYYTYRLRPPPHGYHWVRVDNDVVLAAIASGIVVSAVYGIFN